MYFYVSSGKDLCKLKGCCHGLHISVHASVHFSQQLYRYVIATLVLLHIP